MRKPAAIGLLLQNYDKLFELGGNALAKRLLRQKDYPREKWGLVSLAKLDSQP
jgi:hypothetical protein